MSVRDDVAGMTAELLRDLGRNGAARMDYRAAAIARLRELHHPYAEHPELRAFIHPSELEYARPTGVNGKHLTDSEILDRIIDGVPVEKSVPEVETAPEIFSPVEIGDEFGIEDDLPLAEIAAAVLGPHRASVTTKTLFQDETPEPLGKSDDAEF